MKVYENGILLTWKYIPVTGPICAQIVVVYVRILSRSQQVGSPLHNHELSPMCAQDNHHIWNFISPNGKANMLGLFHYTAIKVCIFSAS